MCKASYPKKGEYILWTIKIEQYLAHTGYALWEVILNGNSAVQMTKDEADVALELGKSMSLTKAAEEEVARQVHATHEWIVTESDLKPARRRPSELENEDNDEDDRSIDMEKTDDDEETNDEFVYGDEYVYDNVDEEMNNAKDDETEKDDEEITDAEKT
nr:hypothetical protein [Tanacetum cinerariifolium]